MSEVSALLLTDEEWGDLRVLAMHITFCCLGPACDHHETEEAQRIRDLAKRIMEATQ